MSDFRPVIMSTARTGSTAISHILFSILQQISNVYSGNLEEYFIVSTANQDTFEYKNNILTFVNRQWFNDYTRWYNDRNQEIDRRCEILLDDKNTYLLKLIPNVITPKVKTLIEKKYNTMIFLERRNKLAQLYSFLGLITTKISHHVSNDTTISKIKYDSKAVDWLLSNLEQYYKLKSEYTGSTIYYEDWLESGCTEKSLCSLLNINSNNIENKVVLKTIPTPYACDPTILLDAEWHDKLPAIIEKLNLISYSQSDK